MNITQIPNLKPLRSYDEHDVIEFFSHQDASANKGTLVSIVGSTALGNTNVWQGASDPATPHLGTAFTLPGTPTRAAVFRNEVKWKVKNAYSGEVPLGLLLYDVREETPFGEKYIYRPRQERIDKAIVTSGEAVPIITRGLFKVNGIVGTPGPGSGAVPALTSGYLLVTATTTGVANVGKFLTSKDADGYALFKLEL
jgi:hypothetical protein